MINVNFVAMGKCPDLDDSDAAERMYILESSWGSEALLNHFFGLLGEVQAPSTPRRLEQSKFDIDGLRRMACVCGDYAKLIETLVTLHRMDFEFFLAGNLVTRNYLDSNPNDVVLPPETRCRSV